MPDLTRQFHSFWEQVFVALQPELLLASAAGAILGIVWGAMPALSTTMAMALLIGFSSAMDLNAAIMFLLAVYMGSMMGASISAVFVNIPGTPAAVCTGIEGFPLAQRGQGGLALGTAFTASLIGNLAGLASLVFLFPLILALALKIGSWELFLLASIGHPSHRVHPTPNVNPLGNLVHVAQGRDVGFVIVDGRVVVEGGRPTLVDEEPIRREAARATRQLWARV